MNLWSIWTLSTKKKIFETIVCDEKRNIILVDRLPLEKEFIIYEKKCFRMDATRNMVLVLAKWFLSVFCLFFNFESRQYICLYSKSKQWTRIHPMVSLSVCVTSWWLIPSSVAWKQIFCILFFFQIKIKNLGYTRQREIKIGTAYRISPPQIQWRFSEKIENVWYINKQSTHLFQYFILFSLFVDLIVFGSHNNRFFLYLENERKKNIFEP